MIRRLLQLNGLAVVSVVLFHSAGMAFIAMFAWAHRYLPPDVPVNQQIGSFSYYYLRAIDQLVVFSIPVFLFVSGYFISVATNRTTGKLSWSVVWARIRYLLIPYLLWSVVVLLLLFLEDRTFSVEKIVLGLLIGNTNEVMYYVPLLTQFYILAPFFVIMAKRNWKLFLAIAAIIQLFVVLSSYPVFLGLEIPNKQVWAGLIPKWFFPARIFWFSLGIAVGLNLTQFKNFLSRYKWVFLVVALACFPVGIVEWETYFRLSGEAWLPARETIVDTIYALTLIFAFLGFEKFTLPFSSRLNELGVKSYGIYLTHAIVIVYASKIFYRFTPSLLGQQILFQLILFALGLGVPLLLMMIVNRSTLRRYYKYIFG